MGSFSKLLKPTIPNDKTLNFAKVRFQLGSKISIIIKPSRWRHSAAVNINLSNNKDDPLDQLTSTLTFSAVLSVMESHITPVAFLAFFQWTHFGSEALQRSLFSFSYSVKHHSEPNLTMQCCSPGAADWCRPDPEPERAAEPRDDRP